MKRIQPLTLTALLMTLLATARAADTPLAFNDPSPRLYELTARASQIDPRARPHPEIAFVHVLDGGWTGDHYCRSWELLGLHQFGAIVNVDHSSPPYGNTRRLITDVEAIVAPKLATV